MANSLPPIRFHPPRIRLDSAAMRKLYHHWLSPFSRKVRILLEEKGLDFQLEVEKTWERREDFLALNPAGLVPVLVEHDGHVLAESQTICEYLDEVYPNKLLRSEEHTLNSSH